MISCGITNTPLCEENLLFHFHGRVGLVTDLDNEHISGIPKASVTFNGGRTSYVFDQAVLKLDRYEKTQWEIWVVIRSRVGFQIVKKKPFAVTAPECTFDQIFDRYLPYTILSASGLPLDTSTSLDST